MNTPGHASPLDDLRALRTALLEQGLSVEEANETAPALLRLRDWAAPKPDPRVATRLAAGLQATRLLADPRGRPDVLARLLLLLRIATLQVRILRPAFWFSSAMVGALGVVLMLVRPDAPRTLLLYLLGPLVGYLAVATVFRDGELGLLECELACPPTPRQLIVARLTIVLAYTFGLGVCLSAAMAWDDAAVLALTWLAPLLMEVGLTLLLSVRISTELAAGLVYAGWASALAILWGWGSAPTSPAISADLGLATVGLLAIALAVYVLPHLVDRQLGLQRIAA